MNEIVFVFIILLPIVWYLGFRIGRTKLPAKSHQQQSKLSKKYFAGLNYLLNEQSDKAIATFVRILELDSEAVDIQLALGNLFRKNGEVERSIRIHQNLIARPSLSVDERSLALLELGYDYMAAGLLDRAENIFVELSEDSVYKSASLEQLLSIYQLTKEWNKAIAVASKLPRPLSQEKKMDISHYYCELAEEALLNGDDKTAKSHMKKACVVDPRCVRATLIGARLHVSNGKHKRALKSYQEIIKQDIVFLPEAIGSIVSCYSQLNDREGLRIFLHDAIQNGGGASAILASVEALKQNNDDSDAVAFLVSQMEQQPSLKGLLKLIELHIENDDDSAKSNLRILHQIVTKLLENKPVYQCGFCGFDSQTLFWQCPSCKYWGSVKPIRGIEGE
ncbi:MAG: lipopolysaccharide assembly protein LapB [Kangiellaceae bacterium]|nr:lipopolysaccharide assembly protein LapB [Kangiellaceae bacterium]